jgi:hypothetical protein
VFAAAVCGGSGGGVTKTGGARVKELDVEYLDADQPESEPERADGHQHAGQWSPSKANPKRGDPMPAKRANVKNEKQYEALKDKGMSKQRAAKIANSAGASKRGGKKSGSGGNARQGGTTAQHKAAGRKGGTKAATKR